MNENKFIILEASAGSGKTHNLAKRYINLLLNFDSNKEIPPLNNILALTFANKATIEMKERIIEYLKKIALGKEVKGLLTDTKLPKITISKNALEAVKSIITNFDHFNVRTIDSFINLIIKACALKLGISPNYKILKNYEDYIDYSIDTFLDKSFTNEKVKNVLDSFFKQYLIDSTRSWYIAGNISENFKKIYKKEIPKQIVAIDENLDYSTEINKLLSKFIELCKKVNEIKVEELIDTRIKLRDYNNAIINGTKNFFKDNICSFYAKEEVKYPKKVPQEKYNKNFEDLHSKARNIIKDIFEFKAKHYFNNYIKMFDSILEEFDIKSKKDSVLFLQNLNKQVKKIFDNEGLPPEIYLSLSNKFTDFLIDEFQDTNKTQWQTLKLLVEDNLSNGGSFFYVGDKKQAIYGFRGSDYKIFDLPKNEFKNVSANCEVLDTNYRSCQAIIDFNNKIFCKDNIKNLLIYIANNDSTQFKNSIDKYTKDIVEVFNNSQQKCCKEKENLGYVNIAYKEYEDKTDDTDELIKQYLYDTITKLRNKFSNKDITVLCRTNEQVEQVSKWLLEKNISIESFQTSNIINSSIIKELFCALQFFNLPIDNIAFAGFVTSEMFLKATKLNKNDVLNFLTINTLDTKNKRPLYTLFRDKYLDIWKEYIEEFFNSAGFVAVYEMVISILSKYKVIDNFKDYNNVILRFLEVISDFEKENQGLQNFIDYFKDFEGNKNNQKFYIKVSSLDAITVITSHKAKGLQFNVVVMPFFDLDKNSKNDNIYNVENENSVSFFNITKDMTTYSQCLQDIYYTNFFKNISDELNVLYVSTTRAIYEFHALILQKEIKKKEDKISFINYFINKDCREFSGVQKYNQTNKVEDKEKNLQFPISLTQFNDVSEIINDSSIEIYGKKHSDILLKGKIIHYALSNIITFNNSNKEAIIDSAIEKVNVLYSDTDTSWLKQLIEKILSIDGVSKFFDDKNFVFNEKEFVDVNGNTIRIDKLVINKDIVNIVDFKNSIYDKKLIEEQMNKYKQVLSKIYIDKKIKCFVVDIENNEVIGRFED